ncbi:uncharacterized protein RSE6_02540 [Rhynchosporium secalis]|uniref:CENP-V/GFA domain-containing protein n=1 Tax=Rhynchosporium secalis TaxID=38038 RepID=A0A1E1M0I1_RHYSE|nr:uncharacterized protein RSE6_02540 [Rhynchosporium secalis]
MTAAISSTCACHSFSVTRVPESRASYQSRAMSLQQLQASIRPLRSYRKVQTPSSNDTSRAECLCGGAKFYITQPDEASKKILAPFPDLMVKSHLPAFENPKHETRCSHENDMKYLADYVPVLHVA